MKRTVRNLKSAMATTTAGDVDKKIIRELYLGLAMKAGFPANKAAQVTDVVLEDDEILQLLKLVTESTGGDKMKESLKLPISDERKGFLRAAFELAYYLSAVFRGVIPAPTSDEQDSEPA